MVKKKNSSEEKTDCYNISAKPSHISEIDRHIEKTGGNSRSSFLISAGLREVRKGGNRV